MDTRKWGPDGWILLHSITFNYPLKPTQKDKINHLLFFNTLQFILPCKYCRESFSDFMKQLPIDNYLDSRNKISKWLYNIHNLVNNKLIKQGLLNTPNPSYQEIQQNHNKEIETFQWNFLYCVIFNYPDKKNLNSDTTSYYFLFFSLLNDILPNVHIRNIYQIAFNKYNIKCYLNTRYKLKQWLFKINCYINKMICRKNSKYQDICNRYESYRSGCSKKNFKGITCRMTKKHTIKH